MSIPSQHYTWLNLAQQKLPPRSRLNHQAPIAFKTPFVESLSSYVSRIAQSHNLHPRVIIYREIVSLFQKSSKEISSFYHSGRSVNKFGSRTEDLVQSIEALTLRNDLRFLTLIPLAEVLQDRNLCRLHQAWCPLCYRDWQDTEHKIYDPLIWAIKAIKICPIHTRPLIDQCPCCKQSFFPFDDFSRPGYCPQCGQWLGVIPEYVSQELANEEIEKQIWFTTNLGNVFTTLPDLENNFSQDRLITGIIYYINTSIDGNVTEFARLLQFNLENVVNWLQRRHFPSFSSLLEISWHFKIPLLNLLLGLGYKEVGITPSDSSESKVEMGVLRTRRRNGFSQEELENFEFYLREVLESSDNVPSLKEIAEHLRIGQETLRKYFPILYAQIKERRSFGTKKLQGLDQTIETHDHSFQRTRLSPVKLQEIETALKTYLENKECPPTLKEITLSLQTTKETLSKYFPELFNAIRKQRIKYEEKLAKAKLNRVETALKQALNDESNSIPFLSEIAKKLGCDTHLLYRCFPDLCKEITAKSRDSQRNAQRQRIEEACEEVREIVSALSKEGVYPSSDRVKQLMSKPNYVLYPEVHQSWRDAVESVKYSMRKE